MNMHVLGNGSERIVLFRHFLELERANSDSRTRTYVRTYVRILRTTAASFKGLEIPPKLFHAYLI
jgi:hypothetical protein